MKSEKCCFIAAIVVGVLSLSAFGSIELTLPFDRPVLLQSSNPQLSGIEQLYVVVLPSDAGLGVKEPVWKQLEEKIEYELANAGIKMPAKVYLGARIKADNIPELRVYVHIIKLAEPQQYILHVQTSLSRMVYLSKQPGVALKADVWRVGSLMQAVPAQNILAAITSLVMGQVEAFAYAYHQGNPPTAGSSKGLNTKGVDNAQTKSSKPPAKQPAIEKKCVASKNSRVFHRADCSTVKRIRRANRVNYNSPDEAIQAGKRACKRCKP